MEFTEKIKDEFEARIKKLEDFIADRGIGSKQLSKARKAQRDVNLAVFTGGLVALTGLTLWALSRITKDH